MRKSKIFVGKGAPVDRLSARPIVVGEVTALTHEVGNDPVEPGVLVAKATRVDAELPEVLRRFRGHVLFQLHDDAAEGRTLAVATDGNVEVDLDIRGAGGAEGGGVVDRRFGDLCDRGRGGGGGGEDEERIAKEEGMAKVRPAFLPRCEEYRKVETYWTLFFNRLSSILLASVLHKVHVPTSESGETEESALPISFSACRV